MSWTDDNGSTSTRGAAGAARWAPHRHGRPVRDRAIVYVLLATGLRREELVRLDLAQINPATPAGLRTARPAKVTGVRGKGRTTRHLFLSADARIALADYLEYERPGDAGPNSTALFPSAASIGSRRPDGRLSPRSVGEPDRRTDRGWHDADDPDPLRAPCSDAAARPATRLWLPVRWASRCTSSGRSPGTATSRSR